MKCTRCGQEFEPEFETNICGNCADDLRAEEEAKKMSRARKTLLTYAMLGTILRQQHKQRNKGA